VGVPDEQFSFWGVMLFHRDSVVLLHFCLADDWRLKTGDCFGNLGGGSPSTPIAANPAEPSAELSQKLPFIAKKGQGFCQFRQNKKECFHTPSVFRLETID
jgi:hypothetical protein